MLAKDKYVFENNRLFLFDYIVYCLHPILYIIKKITNITILVIASNFARFSTDNLLVVLTSVCYLVVYKGLNSQNRFS